MSTISRLPKSTTQYLGSASIITSPVTLVKELLDNSIDANSTSIEIIISPDTVKKIEVRDNGVGIHPDDYDALGRHGHTSKLRSFEELRTRSRKTLGFRGEALASANSLAQVTVTTKIASEPVAAILHIVPNKGGVSKQQRTSAPVGTTVSIASLFGRLPVREQVAIRESTKTVDKIRELLRSYAMARPQLRLSFKVLQSPKQSWLYSPKPGASVKEAAIQLFGVELTTHCFEKTFPIGGPVSEAESYNGRQDHPSNSQYVFEAFILKPDFDPSKVPKQRYLSVDGRPVASRKGTMKKLWSIYAQHINATSQGHSSAAISKDYFISLNIKCPPGSYDENIEPSKDDVLFSDDRLVLDRFKDLCEEIYKKPAVDNPGPQLSAKHNSTAENGEDSGVEDCSSLKPSAEPIFRGGTGSSPGPLLRSEDQTVSQPKPATQRQQTPTARISAPTQLQEPAQRQPNPATIMPTPINALSLSAQSESTPTEATNPKDVPSIIRHTQWNVDMSIDLNERSFDRPRKKFSQTCQTEPSAQEEPVVAEHSTSRDMNPWVIAKMNTLKVNRAVGGRASNELVHQDRPFTPTFEPPMTPDPPILRHARAAPRDLDVPLSQRHIYLRDNTYQSQPTVPGGPYRSPISSPAGMAPRRTMGNGSMPANMKLRHRPNYLPWSPPSSVERVILNSEHATNNEHRPAPDGMKQAMITFNGARGNHKKRRLQGNDGEVDSQNLQDHGQHGQDSLQQMLVSARRSLHHQISQPEGPSSSQRPSHPANVCPEIRQNHRCNQLRVSLVQNEGSTKVKEPIKTSLPTGDPRAYLLRRQKSMAAEELGPKPGKLRRMKSSLLPLENIPSDDEIHFIVLVEVLDIEVLRDSVVQGTLYDRYTAEGAIDNGIEMDLGTGREVEERLKSLLRTQYGTVDGQEAAPEINLCSLLKGKGAVARA
ncbi:hypothetical protein F4677DRAFT_458480 [Hypoxylon crocopeplum]|nr:hypothetical protein F4677DRAFT_458480 [Hypoxylon crocopeplum]